MPRAASLLPPLALLAIAGGCASLPASSPAQSTRIWGFTAPWDARSSASVHAHAAQLNAVVYGWIQLDTITGAPYSEFRDALSRTAPPGTRPMAIVTTSIAGRFHPGTIGLLAGSDSLLARTAGAIARRAADAGYRGLVLDFEGHTAADLPANAAVVRAIADSAHAHAISPVAVAVPALDSAGYPASAFVPPADLVLVMLYDQHWAGSTPGPVAAPDWADRALARRVAEVGARRVVAGFPTYGYRWPAGQPGIAISYDDARTAAAAANVALTRDSATQSLRAAVPGQWELWMTDATLLARLVHDAAAQNVHTIALWRLGLEDPGIWSDILK
ncbi:MAG TPA: hypothetical protein VJU87_07835, partial [Gemmatimonadaceae bacterium]|nr:hypothetical protein [Gemmatimonadaceae bacterium]